MDSMPVMGQFGVQKVLTQNFLQSRKSSVSSSILKLIFQNGYTTVYSSTNGIKQKQHYFKKKKITIEHKRGQLKLDKH